MDINQFIQHIKNTVTNAAPSGIPALQVPQRLQNAGKAWGEQGNTMSDILRTRHVTPQQLSQIMPMLFMTAAPVSNLDTLPLKVANLDAHIEQMNQRYLTASGAERASMRPAILEAQQMRNALAQNPIAEELMQANLTSNKK